MSRINYQLIVYILVFKNRIDKCLVNASYT